MSDPVPENPLMPLPGTLLRTGLPVLSTALFYAVYYLVSAAQFDVHIAAAAVPFDYLLQLLIAYTLFALSRRVWVFVVLQGLLMAVLYVGNAVKIAFFGVQYLGAVAVPLNAAMITMPFQVA